MIHETLTSYMLKRLVWLFVLFAGTVQADNGSDGEIRVAITSDIVSTNSGVDRDVVTDDVLAHVVEGLVGYTEDLEVGLMLARSMSISDGGTTYTFELRDGVRFHNGAPLTSAEVKWSLERYLDPATNWRCRDWYNGESASAITRIETPDDSTVVIRLDRPDGLLLTRMAAFQCPMAVFHPDSVGPTGEWIAPVSTGPFTIAERRPNQYILLRRFEDYTPRSGSRDGYVGRKTAQAETIRWMVIPDPAAVKAALHSGQIDLAYAFLPSEYSILQKAGNLEVQSTAGLDWSTLLIQTDDPLLRDKRLRQAIAHGLNLHELASAISYELADPNPSIVPTLSAYHSDHHRVPYAFDPGKSRRLLKEAGYNGEVIKLQTNRRFESMYDTAIIVQAMLAGIGLNVELEVLDWAAMFSNWLEGDFQLMSFAYSARTDPTLAYQVVMGDKAIRPQAQWENDAAAELVAASGALTDQAKRQEVFDTIHSMMMSDVPFINIANVHFVDATSNRLSGYRSWPAGKPRLWGVKVSVAH